MNETSDARALPTRLARVAFAAMAAVYFFSYFHRAAVPGTIFNELQADLGLSAASVVLMGSMFTWIYGGMQIAVGFLADRYGGTRTFLAGGVIMFVGAAWFPLAGSTAALFAARALTGLGASFLYLSIVRELGRLFVAKSFTAWLGVLMAVGYCGGMAATLPFERVAAAFGWRHSLLAVAALIFAALALSGLVVRRLGSGRHGGQPLSLAVLGEIFRQRRLWPLLASGLIAFPLLFVIQTVLGKKFLQDFGGLSSPLAAAAMLLMAAVGATCVMLGGVIPRRLGRRRKPWLMAGALMLLAAAGLLLAGTLLRAPGWVFLLGYLLLAASSVATPSLATTMKELNQPQAVASAIAVVNGLAYIGSGLIGQAGGWILGRYRDAATVTASGVVYPPAAYVALFCFLTALAGANLIFTYRMPETRSRTLTPETRPVSPVNPMF
jgi:predicted MFS family arabinose efflux permease